MDYLTKPLHQAEVLARVRTHIALRDLQKQIEAQNIQLQQEITERKQAEALLQKAHDELDQRVKERTAELAETNVSLKEEIEERKQAEQEKDRLLKKISENREQL